MNEQDKYVTFEQAETLAREYGFKEPCKTCYDAKTKEFLESQEPFDHNHTATWMGIEGWKYARYSAPTKDDAILYLMTRIIDMREEGIKLYKKFYGKE